MKYKGTNNEIKLHDYVRITEDPIRRYYLIVSVKEEPYVHIVGVGMSSNKDSLIYTRKVVAYDNLSFLDESFINAIGPLSNLREMLLDGQEIYMQGNSDIA